MLRYYHYRQLSKASQKAYKDIIAAARLNINAVAVVKIEIKLGNGAGRYWHKALLIALTRNTNKLLAKVKVGHFKVAQLRDAQSATVKHLNHSTVALPLKLAQVDGLYHTVNLVERKNVGQTHRQFGRF